MRTRLLAPLATAALTAGGLVAAAGPANAKPAFNDYWGLCGGAIQSYCIESATQDGNPVAPLGQETVAGDYPSITQVDANLIDFGLQHDPSGTDTNTDNNLSMPSAVYKLVVRTGTFDPRELDAIARNGSYSIGKDAYGWKFTLTFQPTAIHQTDPGTPCSYDGGCGDSTTKASAAYDLPAFATGAIQTLDPAVSGLSATEVSERTGMYTFTSAENSYVFYNNDLNVLEVRLANPHLQADGVTPVTDGTYDAFVPNAYLIGTMGVPDPSLLSGFTVTKTVGTTTVPATASMTHLSGGIVFHLAGISFSRPTYRLRPLPTPPGRPRSVVATKTGRHTAKVSFRRPLLNGGRAITYYQARCQRLHGTWHYARRSGSPIYVTRLPAGRVWCEVRAHNAKGYGKWSALDRT
ncbi:MAG: hypothetical protein JWQ32_3229 [Marmoricola sp.]|nr:hypothetical protein [Marmoricola sp.]